MVLGAGIVWYFQRSSELLATSLMPDSSRTGVASTYDKSIAVLPFVNMSSDAENEFFADGLVEELLNY